MFHSRRQFLAGAAGAAAAIGMAPLPAISQSKDAASPAAILSLFKSLPGDIAVKIYAPATNGKPEFLVEFNSSKQMFVGSAIKTFILCEALRQADSAKVVQTLRAQQLTLDASVWSVDSATFNPPNLIGKVSERTALEAMIMHSDNTGTDMCLKYVGPDKVREFVASAGLKSVMIPESTRVFFGYLLGAKNYKTFTWEDIGAAANQSIVNSPMNRVESLAASADDFVSYYSARLAGAILPQQRDPQRVQTDLIDRRRHLAGATSSRGERVRQRREHRRRRLSRLVRSWRNALRRSLGLLLPDYQLECGGRNRHEYRHRLRCRREPGARPNEAGALHLDTALRRGE